MEQHLIQNTQHLKCFLQNNPEFDHSNEVPPNLVSLYEQYPLLSNDHLGKHFGLTTQPLLHQLQALVWMQRREATTLAGGMLWDDCGLGKSLVLLLLSFMSSSVLNPRTLFVVPAHMVESYRQQIKQHFNQEDLERYGFTKLYWYHGTKPQRAKVARQWSDSYKENATTATTRHVLFTSYDLVASEHEESFSRNKTTTYRSVFQQTCFDRIILDEAHHIRNKNNHTSASCLKLSGRLCWAVTATPIFNRIDDLFPLISFIGVAHLQHNYTAWQNNVVTPFFQANAGAAQENLKRILLPLTMRRNKSVIQLPNITEQLVKIQMSEQELDFYQSLYRYCRLRVEALVRWVEEYKKASRNITGVKRKRDSSIDKNNDAAIGHQNHHPSTILLSPHTIQQEKSTAAAASNQQHRQLSYQHTHSSILNIVLRLRQACNSPFLTFNMLSSSNESDVSNNNDNETTINHIDKTATRLLRESRELTTFVQRLEKVSTELQQECVLCMTQQATFVSHPCLHRACIECWQRLFQTQSSICPFCRTTIQWINSIHGEHTLLESLKNTTQPATNKEENQTRKHLTIKKETNKSKKQLEEQQCETFYQSSKIKYVVQEEIGKHARREKIVIASQWKQYLDMIGKCLKYHLPEMKTVQIDGQIKSKRARQQLIERFQNDSDVRVCLLSMTAASDGIQLHSASRIVLCESSWNNAMAYQCANRLHRIGQTRPVTFVRLVCQNSIEELILQMADKKNNIATAVTGRFNGSENNNKMAYINNVKLLFQLESPPPLSETTTPRQGNVIVIDD